MGDCGAPDCDNEPYYPGGYCSVVCLNVTLKVAAKRVERFPEGDVSEAEIREVREKVEENHERFTGRIPSPMDDEEADRE